MINFINDIIGPIISTTVAFYIISNLIGKKLEIKIKNIILLIFCVLTVFINLNFCPPLLKIFTSTIIIITFCKIIFQENLLNIVCGVILEQIIFLCSEIIYMLFAASITGLTGEKLINTTIGALLSDFTISLIALIIAKHKLQNKAYAFMIKALKNISTNKLIILLSVSVLIINLLLGISYFKVNVITLLIVNGFFIMFILYILYSVLQEKNLNSQYRAENDALHDSLNTYENLVDQHRVASHENKNQLGTIKQMIENKDETVIPYIERLIKNTYEGDNSILETTKRIPSGGLQGIIYQKLLLMKEKNIPFALNISRDIKTSDFKKLDMDTNINLCKIIGVFLDNAIDEIDRVENKKILVDVYMEDDAFCVKVTNDYAPGVDFSRIDEKGYTTKSNGHGYGLALVKEIIENNPRFSNPRLINRNTFSQIIMVHDMI